MDERDVEIAPWREQLWAAVVVLSALGAVFLGLGLLAVAYGDSLEIQYICGDDNCVEDRRPWVQQRAVPITAFIGCAIAFCIALPALRRERVAAQAVEQVGT